LAKSTVVVAVQGANLLLANICSGGVTSDNTSAEDLVTAMTNGPSTCFINNSSINTSTTLSQNARAYLIINVSDACGLPSCAQVKIEIRTGKGIALMVQRGIPSGLLEDQLVTSAREYRVIFLFRRTLFVRAVTHRILYRNSQYS
jgi:hypothetical protein